MVRPPRRATFRDDLASKSAFVQAQKTRPALTDHCSVSLARGRVGGMTYEIYVDGRYAASFASGWDEAATWIKKHTANRTPLRRLAELGETHHPEEAAAMLSDLLEHQKPAADIAHTLRHIHQFLTGDHVFIWDGVVDEE